MFKIFRNGFLSWSYSLENSDIGSSSEKFEQKFRRDLLDGKRKGNKGFYAHLIFSLKGIESFRQ